MSATPQALRVLVVDDEIAPEVALILRRRGLEAVEADGIDSATEALKQERFDIVVLDMKMPNKGGPAEKAGLVVLEWIRLFRPNLPVLVLTVLDASAVTLPALELGAAGYLNKEHFFDHLLGMINQVLQQQALRVSQESALFRQVQVHRQLQLAALPGMLTVGQKFTIAGSNIRALGGSGDAYDFVHVPERDEVAFLLCDVKGHGVGPALVASRLCGVFRAGVRLNWTLAELDVQLHEAVCDFRNDELFVQGTVGVLHFKDRRLDTMRAGGLMPSLKDATGCRLVGDKESGGQLWGSPIPRQLGATIQESLPFQPGESLVFYTDGVTELEDRAEQPYGDARIKEEHQLFKGTNARALCEQILHQAIAFGGCDPSQTQEGLVLSLTDDVTVIGLHWAD